MVDQTFLGFLVFFFDRFNYVNKEKSHIFLRNNIFIHK